MKLMMSFLGFFWLSLLGLEACSNPDQNLKSSNLKPQPVQPSKPIMRPEDFRLPLVCQTGRASPKTAAVSKKAVGKSSEIVTAFVGQKPKPVFVESFRYVPSKWRALSPEKTALVVCITENMKAKLLESCSYTVRKNESSFKINRYRSQLEVQLVESKIGKKLAKKTFARDAEPCSQIQFRSEQSTVTSEDRYVKSPSTEFEKDVENWLKPYLQ